MDYKDFTTEQQKVIDSTEDFIVVNSCAASGKTETLTEKVRQVIRAGEISPSKIVVFTFTNNAAEVLRQRLGADFKDGIFVGTIHSYINSLLTANGIDTSSIIVEEKFDDLFKLISKNLHCIQKVDYLFLDEAQDSTDLQFTVILDYIKPTKWMFVGDWRQCQPKGTKIWLKDNIIKNIEDVQVGDNILYYVPEDGRCCGMSSKNYRSINKKIEKIEHHTTTDPIITIKTKEGRSSNYTPNHRTYVQFHNEKNKHAVYLMCNSDYRFRVGKISLGTESSSKKNSWRVKMRNENCEKIWLLKYFDNDHDARVEEAKISYTYGIPQSCWQTDKISFTTEELDYIYKDIPIRERAKKCLKDYKHDIRYPFYDQSIDWMKNNNFAGNGSVQIYADNLAPEYMSVLYYDESKDNHSHKSYDLITEVIRNEGQETEVYSLQVEGGNYVADGIITHNCIYGFRGSRPDILLDIAKRPDVKTYNLTKNFRNSKAILNFAKRLINLAGLEYMDTSTPARDSIGTVYDVTYDINEIIRGIRKSKDNYRDWFILARTNAQIDEINRKFDEVGLPHDSFKRNELTVEQLKEKMEDNTVKVLTIHAAKGLERKNVIVVGARLYNTEEKCLSYVAATRARDMLVWTTMPKKTRREKDLYEW